MGQTAKAWPTRWRWESMMSQGKNMDGNPQEHCLTTRGRMKRQSRSVSRPEQFSDLVTHWPNKWLQPRRKDAAVHGKSIPRQLLLSFLKVTEGHVLEWLGHGERELPRHFNHRPEVALTPGEAKCHHDIRHPPPPIRVRAHGRPGHSPAYCGPTGPVVVMSTDLAV